MLFISQGEADRSDARSLKSWRRFRWSATTIPDASLFPATDGRASRPSTPDNDLRGYAWVEYDRSWASEQVNCHPRRHAIFAIIWIVASALLVLLMARLDLPAARHAAPWHARPDDSPEDSGSFPLPVGVHNEIGDLIEAFNRMVASIAEQRSGLNDTLSLLDSMLANAPIGLAFFDRSCRFVRVNQVFADMTGVP